MAATKPISTEQQTLLGKKILREVHQNMDVFKGLTEVITDTDKKIPTEGKPIVIRRDLKKYQGSLSQRIFMMGKLNPDTYTEGDDTLKGNEDPLLKYSQDVAVKQLRKAVREEGYESTVSSPIKAYEYFKPALSDVYAEIMVRDFIFKLAGAPTKNFANTPIAATSSRVVYGGDATTTGDIEATDKMTDKLIKKTVTQALKQTLTGTDGKTIPPIAPINFGSLGKKFLKLVSLDVYDDLLTSADVQQKYRETAALQAKNPLLQAEDIVLYGTVVRKCPILDIANVGTFSTWGTGAIDGAISLFLGAGALAVSECADPRFIYGDDDYENIRGWALRNIWGSQKASFNGQDLGMIAVKTAVSGL